VQRLFGLAGEVAIDPDQVLRLGDLQEMMIWSRRSPHSRASSVDSTAERTMQLLMISSESRPQIAVGIFLHFAHDQFLVERAAIDADAHGLAVVDGHLADGRELFVAACSCAYVSGIDAVFVERTRALRIFGQQDVPVVVEIADDRATQPASRSRATISATAAADSGMFTVIRTSSEPASASSLHCATVQRCPRYPCWSSTARPPARRRPPGCGRP
jgi:hypothetical protein